MLTHLQVDTARKQWKDAGNGNGIVPNDRSEPDDTPDDGSISSGFSGSYSADSDLQDNQATHYVGLDKADEGSWLTRQKRKLGPKGLKKQLLRKTIRRNTWIYVSDLEMNFFVGIKKSGEFQHSSCEWQPLLCLPS